MKFAALPLIACICLALSGCAYEAPDSAPAAGGHEDTVALLKSFIERDPNDFISMYTLARFADRAGDAREAIHWLRRIEVTSWDRWVEDRDFPTTSTDPRYRAVTQRLNARGLLVRSAEKAFSIDQLDLLPEGMAWDPTTDRFLVSSGRQRKVVSVGRDGASFDLVRQAQDGLMATLGMKVDDRRRELWVASAAAPFMIDGGDAEPGSSALFAFDADSGETKGRWDSPWQPALFNDLVVAPDGSVFVTESMTGAVVRRLRGAETMDAFLPKDTFFSPNGIAMSDDGSTLYVADYHGVSSVDVATRAVTRLETPDPAMKLGGIDGLYYFEGRLIAIQNLVGKGRVWSLSLRGDRIGNAEVLESGNEDFINPTTGAISGGGFFFMSNPSLQEWGGESVSEAPEGSWLEIIWIPLEPLAG